MTSMLADTEIDSSTSHDPFDINDDTSLAAKDPFDATDVIRDARANEGSRQRIVVRKAASRFQQEQQQQLELQQQQDLELQHQLDLELQHQLDLEQEFGSGSQM